MLVFTGEIELKVYGAMTKPLLSLLSNLRRHDSHIKAESRKLYTMVLFALKEK